MSILATPHHPTPPISAHLTPSFTVSSPTLCTLPFIPGDFTSHLPLSPALLLALVGSSLVTHSNLMEIWLPKINEADSLTEIFMCGCTHILYTHTDISSSFIAVCRVLFGLIHHDTVLLGSSALQKGDERHQLTLFTIHCHRQTCWNDKYLSNYSILQQLFVIHRTPLQMTQRKGLVDYHVKMN